MRQLIFQVPKGEGERVLELAKERGGVNLARVEGTGPDGALDLVYVHLNNGQVEGMLNAAEELPNLHVTLLPRGVIPMRPPANEAPEGVMDVDERSPVEIFLGGLQQVGSWRGFLGYAAAAGVVVWIGLFTNSSFLLVAAMLIAPFAGPAMNAALSTARGDWDLLKRSLLRYFAALAVTVAVAALLSLVMQQGIATSQMVSTSQVSVVAVLLPLVAGAAGALNLVQSDRSSLVSGAATGMLVAASLAPPAGLVGMAGVLGDWPMVRSGLFVLVLQLVGINLSGSLVFRAFGLSARGARYDRGRRWMFPAVLLVTVALLGGLLFLQLSSVPDLRRSSRSQRASADIQRIINQSDVARLVEADVSFTRASIEGQNTLLALLYVQRAAGVTLSDEEISQQLTREVQRSLLETGFDVTPLVSVTVLEPLE